MPPTLTAILPAWDTFDSIRATLAHLQRQTIASQIEVVFVCPSLKQFLPNPSELTQFHSTQIIEIGTLDSRSRAFAEGVRAGSAPYTVFCEDHCFPVPEWAEALIARHNSGNYAAVGPMFGNANPENAISDVDQLMAYGPFLQGLPGGEQLYIAGHNSCYRRDVLLAEGDSLTQTLETEYILHTRLAAERIKLYVEPRARVFHMNFATWGSAITANYLAAKTFGANRAQSWPASKRLIFAFAWLIVPFLRGTRIIPQAVRAGWGWPRILKATPALIANLFASAAGEWVGNLQGRHARTPSLVYYEFHRQRFSPTFKDRDLSTLEFT